MNPETMRQVAMERMRERARRIGVIRRSVIAGAVATFVLAWGLALSDQLAHGTKTKSSGSDGISTADDPSAASFLGGESDDGESDDGESEDAESDDVESDGAIVVAPAPAPVAPTPSPAPLTTSQS